jgi:hypothetical protein
MNKASGKLAAGVRKVKTPQKAPPAGGKAAASPAAPARAAATPPAAAAAQHPDRVWPD